MINFIGLTCNFSQCSVSESMGGGVLTLKTSTKKSTVKRENYETAVSNLAKKRGLDIT